MEISISFITQISRVFSMEISISFTTQISRVFSMEISISFITQISRVFSMEISISFVTHTHPAGGLVRVSWLENHGMFGFVSDYQLIYQVFCFNLFICSTRSHNVSFCQCAKLKGIMTEIFLVHCFTVKKLPLLWFVGIF